MSDMSVGLRDEVRTLVAAAPGRLSVVVIAGGLDDDGLKAGGLIVDVDGALVVPAASTIKVPILVAALERVAQGSSSLLDLVPIPAERVGGSGALSLMPSVRELPLLETLRLMIALSDNDATNAVLGLVGLDAAERTCRRLGLGETHLRRQLMDFAASDAGIENVTCARDLAQLMANLRLREVLPEAETAVALDLLAEQQFLDGLPSLLPDGMWHANKTGELPGIRHDMALVEHDGHWAAVAVTATALMGPEGGVDRGSTVLPTFARLGAAVGSWLVETGSSGAVSDRGRTDAPQGRHRP